MSRALVTLLSAALLSSSAPAAAQMANALGQPLPDGNLETGTVTIRVVDGDPQKPLAGLTVELIAAQGENRTARTNPQGRASFTGLSPDAAYVGRASVPGDDGGEGTKLETEPFRVPSSGGLRFMLSPKPLTMGASTPSSGGEEQSAPRMDPRRASGIPRPDQSDPPGRLTVRAMQGDLQQTGPRAPVGAEIHLIGFAADGSISKVSAIVDSSERVTFDGLVTGGQVVYYAVALFRRNGGVDRLASQPIIMPPRVGVRLMLAGYSMDSSEEPIDDVAKLESAPAAAPGRVVVRVGGRDIESVRDVELVEVGRPDVIARADLREAMPSADDVRGVARPAETVTEQVEPVAVGVQRLLGASSEPVAGATVRLRIAAGGELLAETVTGADGAVRFAEVARKDKALYEVEVAVHGKSVVSQPFALVDKGGVRIDFDTAWQALGMEASFDGVAPGGDKVYIARVKAYGRVFRSSPFQLTESLGATVNMLVFPGLIVAFHGGGELDDEMFWFQTQFTLYNPGKQPYLPPEGNLEVPLPRGFVSAQVQDEMSTMVHVTKNGLQWRGPVPPGGNAFIATFALPVEGGSVHYELPLPMGAFQSQMILRQTDGMTLVDGDGNPPEQRMGPDQVPIEVLAGVPIRETQDRDGRPLLVLANLNIPPNQSLVLGVRGLPQRPAWHHWVKLVVGGVVVALLAWGIFGLIRARGGVVASTTELEKRRDELFEEIVALERKGQGESDEVADLKTELARVYRQLGASYD